MFFIDGFNLYHSIDDNKNFHKYKWLNLEKLCQCFISKKDTIAGIKYFTTMAEWKPESFKRHKLYIKALMHFKNTEIIYGKFRTKDKKCPLCKKSYTAHEEKRIDVNIAIELFENAMTDKYDTAIIISGDSDLIPAIKAIKTNFPTKRIGIIIPISRRAEELKSIADFHMKIKEKHLVSSQFSDVIFVNEQEQIKKPESWN